MTFHHVTPLESVLMSCYATGIGHTLHPWIHQLHHYIPYMKLTEMRCNMTSLVM